MDPHIGQRLGSYMLLDVLGAGGSCVVYRARHIDLGTEFAVKVLPLGKLDDEQNQRLRREAAAGIRINHPRVVKVLELGISPRGPYLVMELLEGETLRTVIQREGRLAPERAARIVKQTAEGLAAAHRAGFVHRDLKPGNLMLVPTPAGEQVKILDLGIVRLQGQSADEAHLTRDDIILGTPSYMAPEQFQSSHVGPAADLYALGVVLYEMLTGGPPFEGSFREIVAQHMVLSPQQPPESGGLEELAMWLMEKSAANRPPDADRVIEVIDRRFPNIEDAPLIVRGTPETPPPAIEYPLAEIAREAQLDTLITGREPPPDFDLELEEVAAAERARASASMSRSPARERSSRFRRTRRWRRFGRRLAIPLAWGVAMLATALAADRIMAPHPPAAAACEVAAPDRQSTTSTATVAAW